MPLLVSLVNRNESSTILCRWGLQAGLGGGVNCNTLSNTYLYLEGSVRAVELRHITKRIYGSRWLILRNPVYTLRERAVQELCCFVEAEPNSGSSVLKPGNRLVRGGTEGCFPLFYTLLITHNKAGASCRVVSELALPSTVSMGNGMASVNQQRTECWFAACGIDIIKFG
jgi:hypothetical protein